MPQRVSGHRGLRGASHAPHLLLPQFRTAAAAPPPSGDVTKGLTDWGMLCNGPTPANTATYPTGLGDCGAAAFEHGRMAKALVSVRTMSGIKHVLYEGDFIRPTPARTRFLYFSYGVAQGEPGPEPNEGVTNATWLRFLYDQGIVEWYGELDPSDRTELHQAMLGCCGVLCGVSLTQTAEQDFTDGRPWRLGEGQPDHDVLMVRYTPSDFTVVTWGGLQVATGDISEAWAFGTREDAERAGYTFGAIKAAIDAAGCTVTGS